MMSHGQPLLLPSGFCLFCYGEPSAKFGLGACPVCHGACELTGIVKDNGELQRQLSDAEKEITQLRDEIIKLEISKLTEGASGASQTI